jgi:hypothetical protein
MGPSLRVVGLSLTTFVRLIALLTHHGGRAVLMREELLEAASNKLIEAALLLLVAGEDHLATDVEKIAEWVDSSALVLPLKESVYPSLSLSDKCT